MKRRGFLEMLAAGGLTSWMQLMPASGNETQAPTPDSVPADGSQTAREQLQSAEPAETPSVASLTERLTPTMQQAREVALSLLKPSAAELERGLRLHAESIVFDAYGFSPRAAMDGQALAAAIEAGASDLEPVSYTHLTLPTKA